MVKIRLRRFGKRNTPVYRVVVADKRSPRDGRIIEEIGTYDPLLKKNNFTLKLDRVDYWLGVGAQPSDTVASFIRKARKGPVEEADEEPVAEHMRGTHIDICVDVGIGKAKTTVWTCDLTHGYIDINADYRT